VAPRREELSFVVGLSLPQVWEVVSDTQHINQLVFGLSAGTVVERSATKARVRGTFGILAPEYDEYPWVFEVPRRYSNERVFTHGLLRRLANSCELEEADGGTRVRYALEVEGQGLVGGLAASVAIGRMRRGLDRLQGLLTSMATSPLRGVVWPPANPWREETLARARPLLARLPSSPVVERLKEYLADGTDADVSRMRPFALATTWATPRQETLEVFLRAAHAGLLRLSWDLVCPSCEGAVSVGHLKNLPSKGHCASCDVDFTTGFADNVEATFAPEPTVRAASATVFCLGSPSSTRSWLAQRMLKPGEAITLELQLGPGRYRLQAAGIDRVVSFDVGEDGAATVATTLGRRDGLVAFSPLPRVKAGAVTLRIDNGDDVTRRVQLAHRNFASEAATAADVTALGLFRELFGQEVLAPDQHVSVGRMTILFTDLVGSTAMYERLGDAAAYGLVRRHFDMLRGVIAAHHGRVVKTVGDAVMASFAHPRDAVRAGLECICVLRQLRGPDGGSPGLRLKVGVHTGSCLAIEANGSTDYFGRTVNVAARVESLARPDELVVSWAVLADEQAAAAVEAAVVAGATLERDRRQVKGVADEVEVARLTPPEAP
jgi:class 3 adenylate cyclase